MAVDIESLTMHGPGRVHATEKKVLKFFWSALFLSCLVFVSFSTIKLIASHFKHESYVSVTTEVKKSLALPVITMCNGLRMNAENGSHLFTDGYDHYDAVHKTSCKIGMDICADKPKMKNTPRPLPCLIFNPNETARQYVLNKDHGLRFDFFLNVSDAPISVFDDFSPPIMAVKVVFHSQNVESYLMDNSVAAKPGFQSSIVIRKLKIKRLPSPYTTECTSQKDPDRDCYDDDYTLNGCISSIMRRDLYTKCGNIDPAFKHCYPNSNNTNTSSFDSQCTIDFLKNATTEENCECHLPCSEDRYEIKSFYETKWPVGQELERLKNIANKSFGLNASDDYIYSNFGRIVIGYDQFEVLHFQEHPRSSYNTLLSDIGGSMGIFLGASIISIAEVLVLVTSVVGTLLVKIKLIFNIKRESVGVASN